MSNVMPLRPEEDADRRESGDPLVNVEAEQALLGALFVNNAVATHIAAILRPEHFAEEIHRRIYIAATALIARGEPATPITVTTFVGEHDFGEGMTANRYLARLATHAMPPAAAPGYARTIAALAARRGIVAACQDAIAKARDLPVRATPAECASECLAQLQEITAGGPGASENLDAGAAAAETLTYIRGLKDGSVVAESAPTGFADLDAITGGYEAGTLWVLAARPGMGKTIYFGCSARRVAEKRIGVLALSLEVPRPQMIARILADMGSTHRHRIAFGAALRGQIDDTALWALQDAQKRLAKMPLLLACPKPPSVADIRAMVVVEKKRLAARGVRLGVVFIDYLKFVRASDRYRGNRVYEVGEITAGLKALAREEGLCVVLLAQLNRALEAREDKRPSLADLRESGDIEADADVVAFLHRESVYIQRSPAYQRGDGEATAAYAAVAHQADLILGKNRAGETKRLSMWCDVASNTLNSGDADRYAQQSMGM